MEGAYRGAWPCVWLTCTQTRSALWDKWNEVNQQGDCSQAIDFMGHQIIAGLAQHMPFSTRQRLSFSQINSSNYPAPPTAINSQPIILPSEELEQEVQDCWCNHTKLCCWIHFHIFLPLYFHWKAVFESLCQSDQHYTHVGHLAVREQLQKHKNLVAKFTENLHCASLSVSTQKCSANWGKFSHKRGIKKQTNIVFGTTSLIYWLIQHKKTVFIEEINMRQRRR